MTQPYQPQRQAEPTKKKPRPLFWVLAGGSILVAFLVGISACGAIPDTVTEPETAAAPTLSTPAPPLSTTQPPPPITEEPAPECDRLSKAELKAIRFIARNKKIDISAGVALPLPEELQEFNGLTFTRVIALDATADKLLPTFAADDDLIEFVGVNEDAITHFHTSAGITSRPGTAIQNYRDRLLDSDEVAAVERCVVEG